MFTQEDLKKDRKDVINKILLESGRGEVISFCSEVLDKRAYFTVDMHGNIKRKNIIMQYLQRYLWKMIMSLQIIFLKI